MSIPALITTVPAEVAVFFLAMTPLVEMQGAITLGIAGYHLPVWYVFIIALAGNLVPPLLVYAIGTHWIAWVERRKGWLHRVTDFVLRRAHGKLNAEVSKAGLAALAVFVALPFPGAGVWTGSLGAFIIGIPFKTAMPYVFVGAVGNGVIMTLAVTGVVSAFKVFL